jgi:hypothetical protein
VYDHAYDHVNDRAYENDHDHDESVHAYAHHDYDYDHDHDDAGDHEEPPLVFEWKYVRQDFHIRKYHT